MTDLPDDIHFLDLEQVREIHQSQLDLHGGSAGLRDEGLLRSALSQPEASFGGKWLHAGLHEMASAYLFSLVSNHPFVDGNKRVGAVATVVFLRLNGIVMDADKMPTRNSFSQLPPAKQRVMTWFRFSGLTAVLWTTDGIHVARQSLSRLRNSSSPTSVEPCDGIKRIRSALIAGTASS